MGQNRKSQCEADGGRDFVVTPDFTTCASHLKFIYDAPGLFRVRDIVMLTEQGAFSSAEIELRLRA